MRDCAWIGLGNVEKAGDFACFRLDFAYDGSSPAVCDITASARCRLWVNGQAVGSGPCAGDRHVWYYDTRDLTAFLHMGMNSLAVQVVSLDPEGALDERRQNTTIVRIMPPDHRHRFALSGRAGETELSTGCADWRVMPDHWTHLRTDPRIESLGAFCEDVDLGSMPGDWKTDSCAAWMKAEILEPVESQAAFDSVGLIRRFPLEPRPIPLLFERPEAFEREAGTRTGILEKGAVRVEPHTEWETVLDAGLVKMTRPVFRVRGGDGAEMEITYFEKFVRESEDLKRDDWERGVISGIADRVRLRDGENCYEPFYVRTFRFLRLRVRTENAGAEVMLPEYRRTGYPLEEESRITSSVPWVGQLWRMCAETLQNCMLESYMDCPYYEQLQYIMDTRLQMLFHFSISRDVHLARKALEDFHRSLLPCGLLPGRYPSAYLQIISTFSLHYIFMIREYYEQTGDMDVLLRYRADCDRILETYAANVTERGLMGHPGFWAFVDWQDDWARLNGMPAALQKGESTIISLMYAYALKCAARICTYSGRAAMAEEYETRADAVCSAVQALCWDGERGMYREGPEFAQFTQHAQAWAVLCGIGDGRCLKAAMEQPDVLHVTFSTSHEWFRALEKAGMYAHAADALRSWTDLFALDCRTCPETPHMPRSENHAWSAQPMLEMMRCMAGIGPEGIGWERIRVHPHMLGLPDLSGCAATPRGMVRFDYAPGRYDLTLPEGMSGTFCCADGKTMELHSGYQRLIL